MGRPAHSQDYIAAERHRILTAAFTLFGREGVSAVGLRSIGEAVGLSAMGLYRYFPSGKGEILATIRGRGFEELGEVFRLASAGVEHPIERILRLCEAIVTFATTRSDLYRLMFDVTQTELEIVAGEVITAQRRQAWSYAAEAFDAAVSQRMLHGDRAILPHLFFAGIHGVIEFELSRQSDPRRNLERLIKPMIRTLLKGSGASAPALRRVGRLRIKKG